MKSALILILYILANLGCSYFILSLFSRPLGRYLPISLQFSFGTAVLSTLWLFLGLGGQLHSTILWPIVIIMAFLGIFKIAQYLKVQSDPLLLLSRDSNKNPLYRLLFWLSAGVMCWFGILAYIRPPAGDAAAFYMVYPKIISASGHLDAMPGLFHDFSSIGISGELHFAALMILGSPAVAKFFAWIVGVGILLVLRDITRSVGGGMIAQVSAVIILITSTTFTDYLSDGKTDLFSTLLGLASISSILLMREKQFSKSLCLVAGLFCGFSMAAKFSFVIALFPAAVLLLLFQEYNLNLETKVSKPYKQGFLSLLRFGFGVFIGLLPHLLKNDLLFGNPLAPFIGMHNWAAQSSWYSLKDSLWIAATYPAALVFGLYSLMGGSMSVLWIAALGLLLFMPKAQLSLRNPVIQLTISGCFGLLCWVAMKPSIFALRYFLATLIMLVPLSAMAIEYAWQEEVKPRVVSISFVLLAIATLLVTPFIPLTGIWTLLAIKNLAHVENPHSACHSLETSPYCDGFVSINKKAVEGERILVAGYYTYWLRQDLLECINERSEYDKIKDLSPSEIWSALYNQGFMHIAVQKSHRSFLEKLDLSQVPEWLNVTTESINPAMPVFHLRATDPARQPDLVCVRQKNYAWHPQKKIQISANE